MENQLRLHGHMTRDIDRFMRHEVLGQEAYTTVSDDSQQDWSERMLPSIEVIGKMLFPDSLYGLRSDHEH